MITQMAKIELVGPKRHLLPTVDALHRYGRIHISATRFTDLPELSGVEKAALDPEQIKYKAKLEELLRKVDDLLNLLAEMPGLFQKEKGPAAEPVNPHELSEDLVEEKLALSEDLDKKVKGLVKRRLDLKDELAMTTKYQHVIEAFVPMMEKLDQIKNLELIGFTMKKKKAEVLDILREELNGMTGGHFEIFTRDLDENTMAGIVAIPKEYLRPLRRLFISERISELRLPEHLGERSAMETLKALRKRLEEIPREIQALDEDVKSLSAENYLDSFGKLRAAVIDRVSEMDALSQAGRTRMTFILIGWLPIKYLADFLEYARKNLDSSVVVTRRAVTHTDLESDQVPVEIENPPLIKPFELCLKVFPQAKYSSIDPTPFIAISFPTFFGLILGDIAYGLAIVALAIFVHYRYRRYALAQPISVIMFACGTSTILFGFLFGEFLGDMGHRWGLLKPILMNRETAIVPTLVLAVGVGFSHILLGVILKAYNSFKWKHYGHGVEAVSTLVLVVAISALIGCAAGFLPPYLKRASIVAIIIAIPSLVVSGGLIALLEVFGVFGNILSYARIMAIGLSSVILAVVANKIAGEMGNVIVGFMIAALIHLINLILGMFGPTIHSLRLHYVEFFSKFYKTGSVGYKPLTKRSQTKASAQEGGS